MKRTVIRAEVLGFCMGVRRAMDKVEQAVDRKKGERISTFGPLIHNRQALEELSRKGVGRIDAPEEFVEGSVVIRAHGVSKKIEEELLQCGASIIDGTCPRVTRSMRLVEEYGDAGWNIVLVGDPGHGEVQAISGYAEHARVVSGSEEAEKLDLEGPTMVIAQTTIAQTEYRSVVEILRSRGLELEVIDSICPATKERQQALEELAAQVDAIVVIGGLNSSNTKRLQQLAFSFGKPAWHVELPDQLPEEIRRYRSIGITAGASTPDRMIDEVERYIRDLDEEEQKMANLIDAIEKRRAFRALSGKPVERDVQERIMKAAVYAPSCSNKQPWRFIVADGDEARKRVSESLMGGNYWAKKAPLYVVVVTKPDLDCRLEDRRDYALFDVGMASMNLQLQAVEEGLIAHPVAGYDDRALRESFGIPEKYIVVTVVVLGYPGDPSGLNEKHAESEKSERSRLDDSEVISRDGWNFS